MSVRRTRRWRSTALRLVLLSGAALWLALALWPGARALVLSALLLPQILDLPGPRPIVLVSGEPRREEVRLGRASADVYVPRGGLRHGGLVVTLGVRPLDKREPLVASFASGLARMGLVVMLVQSDELIAGRILTSEPESLVDAFEWLQRHPAVDPNRVGLLGFSAGASLAFLAATDPRIRQEVRALGWMGGYADAAQLADEIASRRYVDRGDVVAWEPHPLAREVFSRLVVEGGAGAVELRTLSPIRRIEHFRSRAYLLVDRADPLVPYVHTRLLAEALPPEHLARYVEFDIFEHVQPTKSVPPKVWLGETWKLLSTLAAFRVRLDPAAW